VHPPSVRRTRAHGADHRRDGDRRHPGALFRRAFADAGCGIGAAAGLDNHSPAGKYEYYSGHGHSRIGHHDRRPVAELRQGTALADLQLGGGHQRRGDRERHGPLDRTECWAFGGSSTFSGNIYSLPEKEAPPLPETTLTIQNKMYLPITDLFLRPKDETAWGADRTGAGQIDIGATFSLPLTAGFYDLQIRDQFGGVLFEKPDSPIGVDPGSRKFSLEIRFAVVLRNGTADSLCRIEAKASGSPVGDLKIPGDGVVAAGEDASIEAVAGIYDLVLRRCGDDVAVGNITSKYFGPLSTMLVV
jgi:hypothetical protein